MFHTKFMRGVICITMVLFFSSVLHAQERKLIYNIMRNGDIVGTLNFTETKSSNAIKFNLTSQVKTRFIFTFTANVKEESTFKEGVLTYSSLYRNLNGKEKVNKQTRLDGKIYNVNNKGKTEQVKIYPILYNLHSLYCYEPKQRSVVYSDNFSKYLPIEKIYDNKYKVTMPDGNYNYYYYKDGICQKVEIHHSLYSAEIVLK